MSSAMDLDASLDDIIKQKRPHKQQQQKKDNKQSSRGNKNPHQQKHTIKHPQNKGRPLPQRQQQRQQQQQQKQKQPLKNSGGIFGRLGPNGIQKQSKTTMKPSQLRGLSTPLRSRLGNQNVSKAITKATTKAQQSTTATTTTTTTTNPSNIMITKDISDRLGFGVQQHQQQQTFEQYHQPPPSQHHRHVMEQSLEREPTNFSIRGMSAPSPGISIRGESGPASVLISNLDREANAADIKTACSQFGDVTGCEVFYDRTGRSVGEAEVEFSTKASALDCIAKLDNESADGQILRVTLRDRPNKYVRQQESRPTVSSTISYPSTGKMYADQIDSSRYGVPSRRY